MTNCLFAHGIVAVTAEMNIRFRHPIKLGMPIVLRAKITREQSPLYVVDASLIQENQLRAKSTGKFMEQPI
jgi:acyl-coenzyme A thioesterase PaaI-like protein